MKPNSRESFGEYCLRSLGKPVININVAPEQVLDRIDEALQVYSEKHYDASEKEWIGYRVTADDIVRGYITLPDNILVVDQIIGLDGLSQMYADDSDFGFRYQFVMGNYTPFMSLDLINYYMTVTFINEINGVLNVIPTFEYTRHKNKLKIAENLKDMVPGGGIGIHVYRIINPDENPEVWSDKWLKHYATALIKRQWGSNLLKHGEIQLLGGVTVNGQVLFDQATDEIQKLEDELQNDLSEPINFFIG